MNLKLYPWPWALCHLFALFPTAAVSAQPGQAQYTIPVVFHVLHENGPENISALQIADAIAILNANFDAPTEAIEAPFEAIAADMDIAFVLASVAPDGTTSTGIDRIETALTNDAGAPSTYLNPWPRNRYLNIWVVRSLADHNISYISPLPAQAESTPCSDGVMVYHNYVGSIGTASPGTKRTLTQAVGRFLNLKMVYEDPIDDGPCADDEVEDTPPAIPDVLCSSVVNACADVVANEHNFMSSPYCSNMFTLGQRTRVHACLTSSVAQRDQLASGIVSDTPECSTTGLAESMGDVRITARPNPFSDHIIVEGLSRDETHLELVDMAGRQVVQVTSAGTIMTVLEPISITRGCYFLKVTTRTGATVRKMIKE